MLHVMITPRLARNFPPEFAVFRLDLLVVLILAVVVGAVTSAATGHFEPIPLLAGVIVAGVLRSVFMAKQRS